MSCTDPLPSSGVLAGYRVETTCGQLATDGPYTLIVTTDGMSITPVGNIITSQEVAGLGRTGAAQSVLESGDASYTKLSRHGANRDEIGFQMRRASYPADTTVAAVCDFLPTGTRQDGSTGPQIRAATTSFDPFINYDGGNGINKLMIWVSGAAAADDNGPRVVDVAWDDTTYAYLDLSPGFNAGVAAAGASKYLGAALGSPISSATTQSLTIKVGGQIKDQAVGGPTVSFLRQHKESDGTDNDWDYLTGCRGNSLGFTWSGKDFAEVSFEWLGRTLGPRAAVDPTGQGITAALPSGSSHSAGNNLVGLVVANNKDGRTLVLSSALATGFTLTKAGNSSGQDDISGTRARSGVVLGNHSVTAEVPLTLHGGTTFTTLFRNLQAMGFEATEARADVRAIFVDDRTGDVSIWGIHEAAVGLMAGETGGDGTPQTATLNVTGYQVTGDLSGAMMSYGEIPGAITIA